MMVQRYDTPLAFKTAVEQRLGSLLEFRGKYSDTLQLVAESWPDPIEHQPRRPMRKHGDLWTVPRATMAVDWPGTGNRRPPAASPQPPWTTLWVAHTRLDNGSAALPR